MSLRQRPKNNISTGPYWDWLQGLCPRAQGTPLQKKLKHCTYSFSHSIPQCSRHGGHLGRLRARWQPVRDRWGGRPPRTHRTFSRARARPTHVRPLPELGEKWRVRGRGKLVIEHVVGRDSLPSRAKSIDLAPSLASTRSIRQGPKFKLGEFKVIDEGER